MSCFNETNPNNVFKPKLKDLLAERTELDSKRKKSNNFIERMKISQQISKLDKKIMEQSNLKTK